MRWRQLAALALAASLAACASTQPPATGAPTADIAVVSETATPTATATIAPTATASTSNLFATPTDQPADASATTPDDAGTDTAALAAEGSVTPSMAELGIAGERYAVLGNPDAPITIVEYSDFG